MCSLCNATHGEKRVHKCAHHKRKKIDLFHLLSLFYFNGYFTYMVSFWIKVLGILLLSVCLMLLPTIIALAIAAQYYEGTKLNLPKPYQSSFLSFQKPPYFHLYPPNLGITWVHPEDTINWQFTTLIDD